MLPAVGGTHGPVLAARSAHERPRPWRSSQAVLRGGVTTSAGFVLLGASVSSRRKVQLKAGPSGVGDLRKFQENEQDLHVPLILFPKEDLLLPGRTKQMHLFEPRWVDMVEAARKMTCGMFGMLYMDRDGEAIGVVSLVEILAVNNLGPQGRFVRVRAVGRARVLSVTPEVGSPVDWGLAVIQEMPEAFGEDASRCAQAAAQLSELVENLDFSDGKAEAEMEQFEAGE
ncbi:unnamed protein product, partial [Effrenium voratum]